MSEPLSAEERDVVRSHLGWGLPIATDAARSLLDERDALAKEVERLRETSGQLMRDIDHDKARPATMHVSNWTSAHDARKALETK